MQTGKLTVIFGGADIGPLPVQSTATWLNLRIIIQAWEIWIIYPAGSIHLFSGWDLQQGPIGITSFNLKFPVRENCFNYYWENRVGAGFGILDLGNLGLISQGKGTRFKPNLDWCNSGFIWIWRGLLELDFNFINFIIGLARHWRIFWLNLKLFSHFILTIGHWSNLGRPNYLLVGLGLTRALNGYSRGKKV